MKLTEAQNVPDYRVCVSCGGAGTVRDLGSGEDRPCCICQKSAYAAWIVERQPATRRIARLDEHGRCCGRKPLVYKRPEHHLYCLKCSAYLDPVTGVQRPNWAWTADGEAFVATHPTADYARLSTPTDATASGSAWSTDWPVSYRPVVNPARASRSWRQ